MLELKNIYKTFNPGTINEKRALNGLNLQNAAENPVFSAPESLKLSAKNTKSS